MNLQNTTLRFALLACIAGSCLNSCVAQQKTSPTQQKITALQGLRDSGVISEDEYRQKVAALQGARQGAATTTVPHPGNASKVGEPTGTS